MVSLEALQNGGIDNGSSMLATTSGLLALFAGLVVLLVPLMTPELSRQRDSFWGAVVLLLGLTLVTCSDRLVGAPMVAVLCAALLIGRLSIEVSQGRWRQLSSDEKQTLVSVERWQQNLRQLAAAVAKLIAQAGELRDQVSGLINRQGGSKTHGKRWIRPEGPETAAASEAVSDHLVVSSLSDVSGLLLASSEAG